MALPYIGNQQHSNGKYNRAGRSFHGVRQLHFYRDRFRVILQIKAKNIDSYIGLMHTLFALEDRFGLKVCECDGEVHLRADDHQGGDAAELSKSLSAWREQAANKKQF